MLDMRASSLCSPSALLNLMAAGIEIYVLPPQHLSVCFSQSNCEVVIGLMHVDNCCGYQHVVYFVYPAQTRALPREGALAFECFATLCAVMQTPLEATLTEEESRRNSRRLDLMYVSSSNPVTPDIFYLADQNRDLDAQARAQAVQPLNAEITGLLSSCYASTLLFAKGCCASVPAFIQASSCSCACCLSLCIATSGLSDMPYLQNLLLYVHGKSQCKLTHGCESCSCFAVL